MTEPSGLSPVLKRLVRIVEATLGDVVAQCEGPGVYDVVEAIRQDMVAFRDGDGDNHQLGQARARLTKLDHRQQEAVARAYTIYLELANVCENAFRTSRLRARYQSEEPAAARANMIYVLTAHPTESRSPQNIRLLRRLQNMLVAALEHDRLPDPARLHHLLLQVWKVGTHPPDRPSVQDEAHHLFSLLTDPILTELLELWRQGHRLRLRTWVGGDKDGHPGVGPEQTLASLQLSRARLLTFVNRRLLRHLADDATLLDSEPIAVAYNALATNLHVLTKLGPGDGRRIAELVAALSRFQDRYTDTIGAPHPEAERLATLLKIFPGLVVPLELREERGLFQEDSAIADMLRKVATIASGGDILWYVRACVVSMTSSASDLLEAQTLVTTILGQPELPIVPLLELPDSLATAATILQEAWTDPAFRAACRHKGDYLEVMLGYSDTAKRMGVLASRLEIHNTIKSVLDWARGQGVVVVFFHGSGGSVGRGGGTIADQAATWPAEAISLVKQTLQGEMVERTLATPEILRRQVEQVAAVQAAPPRFAKAGEFARRLARLSQLAFVDIVNSRELLDTLDVATPYSRLDQLTIGSRPSRRKRQDLRSLDQLRAIPWVLCWTQTRFLAHAWLGVGTAWRTLRDEPDARAQLKEAARTDPLLRSYLRLLGFTLAKTEPRIWHAYLARLAPGANADFAARLDQEWACARELALAASADGTLLPDRPWLLESIYYRAPMIHPLNLLQIKVLASPEMTDSELSLFRETVTGIAAGMLTTG